MFFSKLMDLILGKPTPERVASQLIALMKAQGATNIRLDAAQCMLHYVKDGGNGMTNVMSIFKEVLNLPWSQRQSAVKRYFESVWQQGDQLPNSYEEALPKLLPVVRTRAEMEVSAMRIESISDAEVTQTKIVQSQLTENLNVLVVIDLPNSMSQVTSTQLKSWGVTFDQALSDALNNLRKMTDENKWLQVGHGVWMGQWNDAYESSRLLLPDLIDGLGISEPVALVPFRNTLFVTSAGNTQGIELIAQFIVENYEGPRKHLSFEVMDLKEKNWCTSSTQPKSLETIRLRGLHGAYETQKTLLEEHYAKQGEDVFIATFNGLQKDDGSIFSYCVWTKSVDTFLPQVDIVFFIDPEDETKRYKLPWNTVLENFSGLMEYTNHMPPRWRVKSYPQDEVLNLLSKT